MSLKVYCINLPHRTDRWERFSSQVGVSQIKAKYPFEKFSGVNGKALDIENDSRVSNRTRRNIRDHIRRDHEELDSAGGVGCYLSHYSIWKKFLENDKEDYCLIFEDDALIPEFFMAAFATEFKAFVEKSIADVWFLYRPNAFYTYPKTGTVEYTKKENMQGNWIMNICSGFPGYIISKQAAKALIDRALPIEMHVDLYACLLRDMKILRTCYNKLAFIKVFNAGPTDTDIQSVDGCPLCNIEIGFKEKGYTLINKPQMLLAAAALLSLWLISRR
jgi:GR25 family glycosyltransferase involved in LPS biosynthesis